MMLATRMVSIRLHFRSRLNLYASPINAAGSIPRAAIFIQGSHSSILHYLSLSVVNANRAKTSAMIQKRAMTLDSDQPPSSK